MVSVIIPAYNAADYLRECLDSALAQTYCDMELVVVDDGSTDATPGIIAEYAARDPRIRPLRQSNQGLSSARNAGMDLADGEWIVFLDSDDVMMPGCVAALMETARQTGCSMVHGGWTRGLTPPDPAATGPDDRQPRVMDAEEFVGDVLYQTSRLIPSAWAKLYRRELFDSTRFRPGITYEDLDIFYLLAFKAGRVAVTDTPVYFYRDNPSSITNTFSPSRLDVLAVTRRLEDYMALRHPSLLPAARDRRLSANFNMYCLLALHDEDGRHDAVTEECMGIIRAYRRASLLDPRVRLKNKFAAMLSLFGEKALRRVAPLVYGRKGK